MADCDLDRHHCEAAQEKADPVVQEVRNDELRDAVAACRLAERRLWIAVTTARGAGMSWRAIGREVGVAASWLLTQTRRPEQRITMPQDRDRAGG